MGMFGLGAELYAAPRESYADLRRDMLKVQENYYQHFKDHLDRVWIANQKTGDGRIKKLAADPFPEIRGVDRRMAAKTWGIPIQYSKPTPIRTFPAIPIR